MKKVLFIDDEADVWAGRLAKMLRPSGSQLAIEANPALALHRITAERPDVVLLDSLFRDDAGRLVARGSEILARIHERDPALPVVMFTATLERDADESDFPHAVALFGKQMFESEEGNPDAELAALLDRAVSRRADGCTLDERLGFIVGETPAMHRVAEDILAMAPLKTTVLVHGETGTGKELAVRGLHDASGRKGQFVTVDCGVLEAALESQLFGHEKGAYTDARTAHQGLFEEAAGGTLFLDELPAMSPMLQDKLVRVLETKRVRRLGGTGEIPVDVRVVAACNRPLAQLIAEGRFREDLHQRLAALEIRLPPLRERLADLPALYRVLVAKLNRELGRRFSTEPRDDVIARLASHHWPGNVRELENVLRAAMVRARANVLTPSTLRLPEESFNGIERIAEPPDPLDLSCRILAGDADWSDLKLIRGPARLAILARLAIGLTQRDGREPGSKELAALLGTSDDALRQALKGHGGIRVVRQAAAKLG